MRDLNIYERDFIINLNYMKYCKQAFSIIEIIISATILTVGVFWVYKLIGNNMNYIANNENFLQLNMIYSPMRECIKSIGYTKLSNSYNSWNIFSVNFWNDFMWCYTGSYNGNYNFTWVVIDNNEYYLFWKVIEEESTEIKLELNIYTPLNGYLYESWSIYESNQYLIIKK
jgi:hypothetical protein